MKVAYIHQHFVSPKGSSGTRSYEFGQRLLRSGHQVTLICGANDVDALSSDLQQKINHLDSDGLPLVCINVFYSNKLGFTQRVLAFKRFADEATRVVCDLKPDIVYASSTPLTVGIPGMRAAARLRVPFVFEVRDLWPEGPIAIGVIRNPILKWYLYRLEHQIYRAASWIVALSPGMKEGVCRTGFPADRVTVIPNGSDLELFKPCPEKTLDERFGAPDDFRLVFTGAHGPANGLDAVLNAATELKRRGVKGVRFVLIGDGKSKPQLVARTAAERLDDVLTFVRPVPKLELARILPRMHVGMQILKNLPTFYYGTSPNKFFDYIASGLPVLNNYPGWLADMINTHRFGRAVPPDDPRAFVDAVLWLREHAPDLPEMGRRARALAEAEFSRDLLAQRFIQTLEHVHASRSAAVTSLA